MGRGHPYWDLVVGPGGKVVMSGGCAMGLRHEYSRSCETAPLPRCQGGNSQKRTFLTSDPSNRPTAVMVAVIKNVRVQQARKLT